MSSELIKRIFTSVILLMITLYILMYFKEDYFMYFIIIIGIICLVEWLVTNKIILEKFKKSFDAYVPDAFTNKNFYKYFSIYFFGFVYFLLVLPISVLYLRFEVSLHFFLFLLFICIFSDVGGYVFGKNIGGKKLTKISPNKTRSGSIGSFIFSIFPIIIINLLNIEHIQIELNFINILFSLFISLICQLGDLFFSYFKRLNNKKNTGTLLPGHGGLLDRIDGLIIVLPIVYLIKIFGIY